MADYDVIILGGGPGGYSAAQRLGQAGLDVLLAEPAHLGGTSLNTGCIPTQSLLQAARTYRLACESATQGVKATDVSFDWAAMQSWKNKAVRTLVGGVTATLKRLHVTVVPEPGRFLAPGLVEVGERRLSAHHVIVATGAVPVLPPIPGAIGNPRVVDSTALLEAAEPPTRLTVIGGGAIGLELASLFSSLGTNVTVLETLTEIAPFMDPDMAKSLRAALRPVEFKLGCRLDRICGGVVHYTTAAGEPESVAADVVMMSLGRQPRFDGWGAETSGLDITTRGVTVDDHCATNLPGVWAVGDITERCSSAHAAYRMGEIAAALIVDPARADRGQSMRWDVVPYTVFGLTEASGAGLTEQACATRGLDVLTATAPLVLSGRFVAEQGLSAAGSVKIVVDRASRTVLGVHLIGPCATELVWGVTSLLEMELTVDDLRQIVFPHPTLAEGIREACWAIEDR